MNKPKNTKPDGPHHVRVWRHKSVKDLIGRLGFTKNKTAKIGGRVNPELLKLARERAGAESDSQLIEMALGNLVIDDGFPETFRKARGTVDPNLNLEI